MIELLASIEPASLPVLAVLLFAASLYPVGLMLGSPCSPCCGCSLCTEGSLPDTCTVTLSGFPDMIEEPNRLSVLFNACFGNGAAATVTEAGGAISTISLTSGGSGYAILGRTAPTLSFSGQGSGATFTPTLNVETNGCGVDFWQLASVSATGGSGYVDGEYLAITVAEGDTVEQAAVARLSAGRMEPTLTISGNATATVTMVNPDDAFEEWRVLDVTVTDGGSGYTEGAAITFDAGENGVELEPAEGTARVVHDEPVNLIVTINTASGSGAQLEPVWDLAPLDEWPAPNRKTYYLSGFTILNAGSGYAAGEDIYLSFASVADGQVLYAQEITISSVSGTGQILSIHFDEITFEATAVVGSRTDALESIQLLRRGQYYEPTGEMLVAVENPGSYYRVDATEPPYVSSVTVTIFESPGVTPSEGAGATFDATVDDDPTSPTFGEITALSITNGGSGYQDYREFPVCCGTSYNDRTFVLQRSTIATASHGGEFAPDSSRCIYEHRFCGVGNLYGLRGSIRVEYRGPSLRPRVLFANEVNSRFPDFTMKSDTCTTTLTSTTNITDCDDLSFTATDANGATAVVTPGGEYDPEDGYAGERSCSQCCRGTDEVPQEIEVSWVRNEEDPSSSLFPETGIYSLTLDPSPYQVIPPNFIPVERFPPARAGLLFWTWTGGAPGLPFITIAPCVLHDELGRIFVPLEVEGPPPDYLPSPLGIDCPPKCAVGMLDFRDWWYGISVYRPTLNGGELNCQSGPICRPHGTFNTVAGTMTVL